MLASYFAAGGPLMFGVLAAWIVVLAVVLDRLCYGLGSVVRRPYAQARRLARRGCVAQAHRLVAEERRRAARGLPRLEAVSQLATSVGLFGTVLGISQSFLGQSGGALADPEALAAGLSTALYTTVGGLAVFLFGQGWLIVYREWLSWSERGLDDLLELAEEPGAA